MQRCQPACCREEHDRLHAIEGDDTELHVQALETKDIEHVQVSR